jgi:hypothetical protein
VAEKAVSPGFNQVLGMKKSPFDASQNDELVTAMKHQGLWSAGHSMSCDELQLPQIQC